MDMHGKDDFPNFDEANQTRPKDVSGIPFHTFSDIHHAAEVVDFIEDLLAMGAMSIIYGQSNCGKTFWVQDLVKHVIAGIPWRGQAVDRGAVLYLALEGGRQAFNNRIFALKQEMGWEGQDLPEDQDTKKHAFARASKTLIGQHKAGMANNRVWIEVAGQNLGPAGRFQAYSPMLRGGQVQPAFD